MSKALEKDLDTVYECMNCDYDGKYKDFSPAEDILIRHEMGDSFSDIQCPKCGALAHEALRVETYDDQENEIQRATYLIHLERIRQNELKAEGRFKYTCADLDLPFGDVMNVLMEEVGELSRAYLEYKALTFERNKDAMEAYADMKKESIQVAAVALAILERFTVESA